MRPRNGVEALIIVIWRRFTTIKKTKPQEISVGPFAQPVISSLAGLGQKDRRILAFGYGTGSMAQTTASTNFMVRNADIVVLLMI